MRKLGQEWARLIMERAEDSEGDELFHAINALTKSGRINRSSLIVACSQMLAQCITDAPRDGREIRAGILSLIDGFAMSKAVKDEDA